MGETTAGDHDLQVAIERCGGMLFDHVAASAAPLFSTKGVHARMLDWAMRDEAFKARLFRFVDVLPVLGSNAEIVRHLREYLGDAAVDLPPLVKGALAATGIAASVAGPAVRANVVSLARQFIAGADTNELCATVAKLHDRGIAATVDLLGELVVTDAEARHYQARNLETLDALAAAAKKLGPPCASDVAHDGPLPRVNLSIKVSALHAFINTVAPEESLEVLKDRLRPILRRAAQRDALINFDMESYALKDFTLRLFRELREEDEFADLPAMGIALQAYLRDGPDDLEELVRWARKKSRWFTVRLVKGAYWDYECIAAGQRGWPVPVWSRKTETDAAFERMTCRLVDCADIIRPAFGTHNIRSIAHAIARAEARGLDPRAIEFQMLYGMADPIKEALRNGGWRVREYCPAGELLAGMAYFVRRLLENTSNEGFMKQTFVDHADRSRLLADPFRQQPARPAGIAQASGRPGAFANAPALDFSQGGVRSRFAAAIAAVRKNLGRDHAPVIDGTRIRTKEFIDSVNPAAPVEIIGRAGCASVADADAAVAAAHRGLPEWSRRTPATRADILDRAAAIMRDSRLELAALEVLEAGKPWAEADADVTEAIDFCVYYAREMRVLAGCHANEEAPGETSITQYVPRGVAAVIAPWNFPLAILCGMTTAALVTGNTVVMKPAEQTPVIAARLFEILREAGVPAGALHFLPGRGEEVGARLVGHPRVDLIAFTGSREVGLGIWATAGRTSQGQTGLKKVICEMGGRNALIVDDDADLDEAVPGALYSAFGFAGQKCSALSRLIVLEGVYDKAVERLVGGAEGWIVGVPEDPRSRLGPVIDATAQRRILGKIEAANAAARLAWQGDVPPGGGYFVPPAIFTEVEPESPLAREEIFGPVLAVFKARDFDHALALANDSEFALTGGVYSRSPAHIERVRSELVAGNVYINRPITGAIVGRHPFGGFRMSGGGTKAGGADYLREFMIPRVVVENILRRGFAPEPE